MNVRSFFAFLLATTLVWGCGSAPRATPGGQNDGLGPGEAGVDLTRAFQSISGFGASSAWTAPNLSDALSDQLFSAESGIGLSLLRVRITPAGDTDELGTARKAVARGARIWATPWTPPGAWKTNGSDTNGGSLLAEHYPEWAERLAQFAKTMSDRGVPLLMLSAQNEPNYTAEWETCRWTPGELVTFIRDYLGPAVRSREVSTELLGPETIDWNSIRTYADPILKDEAARGFVGAIATHGYNGHPLGYATPAQNGKQFWVTELDDGNTSSVDPGMSSGLRVAKLIHDHLTIAQVNAWHYWWLAPRGDAGPTNAALTDGVALTRRAYVVGNYSKFVRPGFVRVQATPSPQSNVLVTAFYGAESARLVIVAVNQRTSAVSQRFVLSGESSAEVVPWITSAALALAAQPAVAVADGAFSFDLPPQSVTTFVGD